jgi:hypothetical protein
MDAGVLLLRTSALLLFSFNVMLGGTLGQLVVFGRVVPGLGSLPLSLLYSAEGVGAVVAAFLVLLNAAAALFTGLRSDTTTAQSGPEEQEPGHLMVREDG